jgi:hypothetical protein
MSDLRVPPCSAHDLVTEHPPCQSIATTKQRILVALNNLNEHQLRVVLATIDEIGEVTR